MSPCEDPPTEEIAYVCIDDKVAFVSDVLQMVRRRIEKQSMDHCLDSFGSYAYNVDEPIAIEFDGLEETKKETDECPQDRTKLS